MTDRCQCNQLRSYTARTNFEHRFLEKAEGRPLSTHRIHFVEHVGEEQGAFARPEEIGDGGLARKHDAKQLLLQAVPVVDQHVPARERNGGEQVWRRQY